MKRGPKKQINGVSVSEAGVSSRKVILEKASEIINERGMATFKVDILAAELNMSTGNINYHFSRKEDIAAAVLEMCLQELTASLDNYISPLMDIKQLFMFCKYLTTSIYKHRGVVMHRMSDLALIRESSIPVSEAVKSLKHTYDKMTTALIINGYISHDRFEQHKKELLELLTTIVGWWIIEIGKGQMPDEKRKELTDRYALNMVMALKPVFTEEGCSQLDAVYEMINR